MAAGPVGAVWASGSWSDTAWESDVWAGAGAAISDGDEVMVMLAPNGIACSVVIDSAIGVRVKVSSAKQVYVVQAGGTPVKVTI